jgi:hypothetical protein
MNFVLGMSHAINVLKALSNAPLSFSHENWVNLSTEGQFFDVQTKLGLLPGDVLKAFIVTPACGWGLMAQMQTLADGSQNVVGVEGYIHLLQSLKPVQDNSCLFSFVHGNEHSVLSMVQHPEPYDFFLPWRTDLDILPGYQPIAYEVVRLQMEQALSATLGCLAMMRLQLPGIRLVHVLPPPPVASEQQIMKTPEIFKDQFARFGITPVSIRVKYYLLLIEVLRQALTPYRIELLECPAQACRDDHALRDDYAYAATHANEAYGALVAQQMKSLVGGGN